MKKMLEKEVQRMYVGQIPKVSGKFPSKFGRSFREVALKYYNTPISKDAVREAILLGKVNFYCS